MEFPQKTCSFQRQLVFHGLGSTLWIPALNPGARSSLIEGIDPAESFNKQSFFGIVMKKNKQNCKIVGFYAFIVQ